MEVHATSLPDVRRLVQQRHADDRGWFARAWCAEEMAAAGLDDTAVQVNFSRTVARGTVRGLHHQVGAHAEAKTVWVLSGAILDVAVDLRDGSPTWAAHVAVELSAANGQGLAIPPGFGHGFQALTDDVTMVYVMGAAYSPGSEAGVAYDDPTIGIPWPLPVSLISDRDRGLPRLEAR